LNWVPSDAFLELALESAEYREGPQESWSSEFVATLLSALLFPDTCRIGLKQVMIASVSKVQVSTIVRGLTCIRNSDDR
jgi:hypothetical protein